MEISGCRVQKMGRFGTLICLWNKAGKCIFHPGTPKPKIFPPDPNMVGPLGDNRSSK